MKKIKLAINGFGRIGRAAFKVAIENPETEVVALNDLTDPKTLAYLLKHDSVYRKFERKTGYYEKGIVIDDTKIPVFSIKEPEQLPWEDLGVDVVIESTGVFTKGEDARKHLQAGAKRVIISAPSKSEDVPTYLMGVNDDEYQGEEVISCASCTTNCIAPIIKLLDQEFGVEKSLMATIHAYTSTQSLVDGPNIKDLRRGRAAAINTVPTTTGAATTACKAYPKIKGLFNGNAYRVPTICGSISDVVALLKRDVTEDEINTKIKEYSGGDMKGILSFTEDDLVSSDIIGNKYSSIVDLKSTMVVGGNLVKVVAWYDNEWGYSERLIEEVVMVGKSL